LAISDKYKYYCFARKSYKLNNITLIEKAKQKTAIFVATLRKPSLFSHWICRPGYLIDYAD